MPPPRVVIPLVLGGVAITLVVLAFVGFARYAEWRRTGGLPQVSVAEFRAITRHTDAMWDALQDGVGKPIDEVIEGLPATRWDPSTDPAPDVRRGAMILTRERVTTTETRWHVLTASGTDLRIYTCDGLVIEHDPAVRQPTVETGYEPLEAGCDPRVVALLDGYRYVEPVAFSG